MTADLVLTNGHIYTVDERFPVVDSLALDGERILAVGGGAEIASLSGPGTRVVNLAGRAVIPGLIDAHLHLLSFGLGLRWVDLQAASSVREAVSCVASAVGQASPGEWVRGAGWDGNGWDHPPTRWDLDGVSPGNPVLLASKDGHVQWVNSLALRLAGIGPDTSSPAGGEIVRDPESGPTGLLRENAARLVWGVVPEVSPETCESALEAALRIAASKGLTGLHTMEDRPVFIALQRLRERGGLTARVCCALWREVLPDALRLGVRTGFGDEWIRLGHIKLFLDGALGSQTAHMLEPYTGSTSRGIEVMTREELKDLVLTAGKAGIAPAVHAIGDAANRVALDVFEDTASVWKSRGLRPRVEHVQLLHSDDAQRLGALGVIASMQPSHATSDWRIAERHLSGRTGSGYVWKTVLESGAVLAFGSDCPVESIDPLPGLYSAVTRQTAGGEPSGGWHPEQRLTPKEALRAYTLGSAYASGEESIKGSLAAGKLADFVVLSADPFAGRSELFLSTQVEATVVGGQVVYGEL